jgi:MoaA/NifB/PqqE/SkfB family radical SAM enzyme
MVTPDAPAQPAPIPRRLDVKVGFSCNNRCVFCVQGDKRDRFEDRTTEEVRAVLAERRAEAEGVVFTGGEATVRSDILELVAYARALGFRTIQLQTNGRRLAYRAFVRELARAGCTEVSPALHGSTAPLHDALTQAPGAFEQVIAGIRNARRYRLPVITNSVVVTDNVPDLPALTRLLVSLDVQQLQFAYVHPIGTAQRRFDEVVPRFGDALPFIHRALDVARAAGVRAFTEAIPYCLMQGYEEHVVETRIPATCVVDARQTIEDYTAYRLAEGKLKGPRCEACTFGSVCEGPWREYPERFGFDELSPRQDDPAVVLAAPSRVTA